MSEKVEINKRSNLVLKIVVVFAIVLIIAVLVGLLITTTNVNRNSARRRNEAAETSATEDKKNDEQDKINKARDEAADEAQKMTDEEAAANPIEGAITYTGQVGDTLQVRAQADEPLDGGTCILTLTNPKGERAYSQSVKMMIKDAKTATCNGFDVDMDDVTPDDDERAGTWTIGVELQFYKRRGQLTSQLTL